MQAMHIAHTVREHYVPQTILPGYISEPQMKPQPSLFVLCSSTPIVSCSPRVWLKVESTGNAPSALIDINASMIATVSLTG